MVMVLLGGLLVGGAFGLMRLPLPAPPTVEGLAGIVALWGGWQLVTLFLGGR